jgi:hypothetical protein
VTVHKAYKTDGLVLGPKDGPSIQESNRYSLKVTGRVLPRSLIALEPAERWIAPHDLVSRLAGGAKVRCGQRVDLPMLLAMAEAGPVISTMAMPILMKLLGWNHGDEFESYHVWSVRVRLNLPVVDVYQTIYYPDDEPYYRASLTGDLLIVEYMADPADNWAVDVIRVLQDFGIREFDHHPGEANRVEQRYGKLVPYADESERRAFILGATDRYGIYSLGRFATWRQILLDDLVKDISVIRKLIQERNRYSWMIGE